MSDKVLVVVSTYNGEKYLREQLDSILAQEGVNVDILIRDDGSTDNTLEIIDEYHKKYSNIQVILGENLGYASSFLKLIQYAEEYPFCALSDQDDVWRPKKLKSGIDKIRGMGLNDRGILYYSNSTVVNERLEYICELNNEIPYVPNRDSILINGSGSGFTFIMNQALIQLIKRGPDKIHDSHDRWIQYLARYLGEVIYDPEAGQSFHRFHQNNTSNNIIKKISYMEKMSSLWNDSPNIQLIARDILDYYDDLLTKDDKNSLWLFAKYNNNLKSKVILVFSRRFRRQKLSQTLLFKLRIITNSV